MAREFEVSTFLSFFDWFVCKLLYLFRLFLIRDYVQRSFNAAPHNIDAIENELKKIIATKLAEGALYQTDWTEVELPKSCRCDLFCILN